VVQVRPVLARQAVAVFMDAHETDLANRYLRDGVVIQTGAAPEALHQLRKQVAALAAQWLDVTPPADSQVGHWLDHIHLLVPPHQVNDLRVSVMAELGDDPGIRTCIFAAARPMLEVLVGNELAMQLRPNLSVQLPGDTDSALALHADTWSGHSPFETVVWIPLVDCYRTKSLYLVPPVIAEHLWPRFTANGGRTTNDLFDTVADDVVWIDAAFGEVVLFDQSLPHGNRVNGESTTRWSLNCRFTGLFTPYGDKGLGDFFTPITMRAVTRSALGYQPGYET
jgi:sporadic carbohydrate cluster 2OG-Fe(II) oxygenase